MSSGVFEILVTHLVQLLFCSKKTETFSRISQQQDKAFGAEMNTASANCLVKCTKMHGLENVEAQEKCRIFPTVYLLIPLAKQ